jgi:hypothetical protein
LWHAHHRQRIIASASSSARASSRPHHRDRIIASASSSARAGHGAARDIRLDEGTAGYM